MHSEYLVPRPLQIALDARTEAYCLLVSLLSLSRSYSPLASLYLGEEVLIPNLTCAFCPVDETEPITLVSYWSCGISLRQTI
jgi:hypothetical protein